MKKFLIDSCYINDGGGFVLLKYLISYLEKNKLNVFYLLDSRCEKDFLNLKNCSFINASMIERYKFYSKIDNDFDSILCFGNVPPPVRVNAKTVIYFHQPLFLSIPENFSLKNKIIYKLKQMVLSTLRKNADIWLVQSEYIKQKFSHKYLGNSSEKVLKLPFYPQINFSGFQIQREKGGLLYVSNSSPHKNHVKLIEAFCLAYDEIRAGHLTLTVPQNDEILCSLIKEKKLLGYPIFNVGFQPREKLTELYLRHEYLIFPSLAESFGLGLAEAIDGGCKVIASDLPYTYEVCKPSLIFDPNSLDSIKLSIIKALEEELPSPLKLIDNDISKLINILME
ncbi:MULTISPECIES: glycosyltransferase [unclassified Acinetobacter]|uniref:glycosyltransferase n=1 Tax=unclassified Acinetobacter TaxID=196816 RepID=UPI0015D1AEAF|nr:MULTISPECIES: glycosyltransferase [unclassified Acinetobacter]